ncbi:MAG: transpanse [Parcubacteria group bacterium GW2011_GWC1_42_11]|uniref:Transpanse n=1 Tax=Candidatus Nomurabacteria bacterium GW2011_GWC2_42_20 TaxID=1618756 RepID=A0A0G1BNC4_9BACT|nr:MAG: transpanse [Parcubacteria group bacterium GW2011_GWC1_42_11]KKS47771.1 MAG: transpanse [Candidatus Nomurabacteria bacterium GW2011_GWC2_42_20]KKS57922.1 MAG: transpanse [Candidatus Nomurabacteria bacterium GW2011_GWA2_42_41]KKT09408.1 MAG: transpanse [Candidatus Nomurabacteria bacterium GW2011_GWB1_43_20]TAN36653.1 MAG: hypothetical protein EPN27_01400 [Patescibacteria group bacterium]HBH71665.1 hypothetical protein [Candidatus Yonathbacteria bacterium]
MGYRKTPLIEGEYYHVYNRGNSKQNIFLDNEDRDRFVKLLYLCNSERGVNFRDDIVDKAIDVWDFNRERAIVSIGAWVLMPNHFHIYVTSKSLPEDRPRGDESTITEFMRKLSTGYSSYFNKKYNRTGSLFEGRFKATHVSGDIHAKYLFSYIHLNPVKLIDAKWKDNGIKNIPHAVKYLEGYQWSSYKDHAGVNRNENLIISLQDFPEYFASKAAVKNEIFEWLSLSKD